MGFGDLKLFGHQICSCLEILVRFFHADNADDLGAMLLEVRSECLKECLT